MRPLLLRGLVSVTLAGTALGAAGAPAADPLDPVAAVPPPTAPSTLARYRPWSDTPPTPWPEAQRTVQRIGGWRAYLREAQQPEAPASAASANGKPAP